MSLIIHTDRMPDSFAGYTIGPLILIRPAYKDDQGLIAHEEQHVKDWLVYTLLALAAIAVAYGQGWCSQASAIALTPMAAVVYGVLYRSFPAFRLQAEARCYAVQAHHYADDRRPLFASFIAQKYGLSVTQEQALRAIKKPSSLF